MHFGTDIDDITVLLLLLQSSFYIGNCYIQCNILFFHLPVFKIPLWKSWVSWSQPALDARLYTQYPISRSRDPTGQPLYSYDEIVSLYPIRWSRDLVNKMYTALALSSLLSWANYLWEAYICLPKSLHRLWQHPVQSDRSGESDYFMSSNLQPA